MANTFDVEGMRAAVREGRISWQRHALERMMKRDIRRSDVLGVLQSGELIEDYPTDRPFPSALFLGRIGPRPLHVIVALDPVLAQVFVITAYEPDPEHFGADSRTRRPT